MSEYINKILADNEKIELVEGLTKELEESDKKVIVVLIEDKEDGKYSSQVMTLGIQNTYEGLGILDIAKQDLITNYD